MKKMIFGFLTLLLTCAIASAQDKGPAAAAAPQAPIAEERLRLAASTSAYPVTPGDDYRLTFQQGGVQSTLDILVGSDYTIQMNVFGKVNAAGMAFAVAKQTVEKAFIAAYPRSTPILSIASVGVFQVFLTGETLEAQNVTAWGMSRLSDILGGRLGLYSSLRDIQVVSLDGTTKRYDLFQFQRLGRVDQNPYLKAGDTVVISSSQRSVEISGEVKRPGRYQLLPTEQLKEMIESFGGGLTSAAETSRIRIDRFAGEKASTLYVALNDGSGGDTRLEDGDAIIIPSKTTTLPVAFFEGAVVREAPGGAAAAGATPAPETTNLLAPVTYNRIPYSFRQGETLRSALVSLRSSILPTANLAAAFVVREGISQPIPVDLAALLSGTDTTSDFALLPLDRIVIPSGQFSVLISGDVARPGSFPYTPLKNYRYYADMAGFSDIEEIPENILVLDSRGARRDIADVIEPGSRIYLTAARVTVQGAVLNPGNFTYRRDYSALNYENLAGGFDPEKSTNSKITVFDPRGIARKSEDAIQPGDRVYVEADKFSYNLGRAFPVFLSVVTATATIVTIYMLLR